VTVSVNKKPDKKVYCVFASYYNYQPYELEVIYTTKKMAEFHIKNGNKNFLYCIEEFDLRKNFPVSELKNDKPVA